MQTTRLVLALALATLFTANASATDIGQPFMPRPTDGPGIPRVGTPQECNPEAIAGTGQLLGKVIVATMTGADRQLVVVRNDESMVRLSASIRTSDTMRALTAGDQVYVVKSRAPGARYTVSFICNR